MMPNSCLTRIHQTISLPSTTKESVTETIQKREAWNRGKLVGAHSMRRTKATLIYKRTKNLRAIQLLLGHTRLESTVRYLGIEVDDALEISEQTEIQCAPTSGYACYTV